MSIFNLMTSTANSDGVNRDLWATSTASILSSPASASQAPSPLLTSNHQPSQSQSQSQFGRRSVSGPHSSLTSIGISSQSIDEDSPLQTLSNSSLTMPSPFDSEIGSALSNSATAALPGSLVSGPAASNLIHSNNSSSNSNIFGSLTNAASTSSNTSSSASLINGSNTNASIINSNANPSSNHASFIQSSPFSNIQQPFAEPQQQQLQQRRFTWTTTTLGAESGPMLSSGAVINNIPFTSTQMLSSLPKYRESPQQQTPIQTPTTLHNPYAAGFYPQSQPQPQLHAPSPNAVAALFKKLDDTVFELKSEFKLLELENSRLRFQLKQYRDDPNKYGEDSSAVSTPSQTPISNAGIKPEGLETLEPPPSAPPTLASVVATGAAAAAAATQPGTIGSKAPHKPAAQSSSAHPPLGESKPIPAEPKKTALSATATPGFAAPPVGGGVAASAATTAKKFKILKKDSPTAASSSLNDAPNTAPEGEGSNEGDLDGTAGQVHINYRGPRGHVDYNSGYRSPPESYGYEAVVYGVEKTMTMEQIRDDLENNDIQLACMPRPLMRTDKNSTLPVHSVVITLMDEDTFKQCIEHSLPINYSMRRVKALRTYPRMKKRIPGPPLGSSGEWRPRRLSHQQYQAPQVQNEGYSDEEEESGEE